MGGQRDVAHQRAREDFLALVQILFGEPLAHVGELDVAAFQLGEPQHLQRFRDREEFVDFQLQIGGQIGQVRPAVIGRGRDGLDEAGDQVGGDTRQMRADAAARKAFLALGGVLGAPGGHLDIDVFDHGDEGRVLAIARLAQVDLDLRDDAARIGREQQHAVAHQDRFLDVVGDQDHALDRQLAFAPQIEEIGAQVLRRQHVERRERLVHQKNVGMHDQRARKADALAHAAGQLARIGRLRSRPDRSDRWRRARARGSPSAEGPALQARAARSPAP